MAQKVLRSVVLAGGDFYSLATSVTFLVFTTRHAGAV